MEVTNIHHQLKECASSPGFWRDGCSMQSIRQAGPVAVSVRFGGPLASDVSLQQLLTSEPWGDSEDLSPSPAASSAPWGALCFQPTCQFQMCSVPPAQLPATLPEVCNGP